VLVIKGRGLSSGELIAFSEQFGLLDRTLSEDLKSKPTSGRKLGDGLFDVSTVDAFGQVADRNSARTQTTVGSRVWHTDGAYKHRPYRYSMLCAEVLPSWGGSTEYADLRAAYDALDEASRQLVAGRNAEHDFYYWLTDILGFPTPSAEDRAKNPAVVWPLVRTHPGSGRKLLWIETAVSRISSMSVPEGRALARDLLEHATHRSRTYRHLWQVGDLVMWDNRAVLHRGRLFDYSERRELQRATTMGDDESLGVSSDALLA
jgi:alpha-ketoglutarate-dependent 2,4-dichlorophenoxyacetate dioxygenase